METSVNKIHKISLLAIVTLMCISMSPGPQGNTTITPSFVPLDEGQGKFMGTIYDDKNDIPVKNISFTGHTSIGGIRKETDDSINKLELSKIKEIKILKPVYVCPRYADKEFILAKAIANNGTEIDGLLIPRHVVICALEANTQMEKAWFLYQVSKITLKKEEPKPIKKEDKPGFWGKLFEATTP